MKKLLFIVLAALTIASCNKKETETTPQFQDVSFTAIEITPDGGLKSTAEFDCVDNTPNYAHFTIAGITDPFDAALFELDGVLYTQAIKLPVQTGNYCVTQFFLYDDVDGSGDFNTGDVIVYATPNDGSHYGAYVTDGIEYCFPVTAFTKAQLEIEVLCFEEADYTDFGFDWFAVTEIVVRQFCFFGDICITDETFDLYANSIYAQGGVDPDEEAVFRVVVKDNGVEVPYSPFSNETIYGTGEALCVDYPDNLTEVNNFTFELQVWLPSAVPGVFVWQTYATFTSTDAGNLFYGQVDLGNNTTVKSFAIGDCSPMSNPIFDWLAPLVPPYTESFGFRIKGAPGDDIYLGVGDLGVQANRVQADAGNPLADGTYPVTFTYDNSTNVITLAFAGKSLVMDMDDYTVPCTTLNGFVISLRDSKNNGALAWQNVVLAGNPLGSFGIFDIPATPGWSYWAFAGDFTQSFTVTADLQIGNLNGNESLVAKMYAVCF